MYIRFSALLGAAVLAAALSLSNARAASPPLLPVIINPVPVFNGWWTCPDTGVCSAPTLRLWLPALGGGYATVESGPVTRSCGADCYEIPNGAQIVIRAHASSGYRFTGWGGKCSTVTTTGCLFHMRNNYVAGATFDPIPPPPPPPRSDGLGTTSQPITGALDFVVHVSGRGAVSVPGSRTLCTAAWPCTVTRDQGVTVRAVAISPSGRRFLHWGGSCSGTQTTCTFTNDYGPGNRPPSIVAYFG